jgi:DNA-binding beta-propeller fold protein YncE
MKISKFWLLFLSAGLTTLALADVSAKDGYKILKKIHLKGDGGWDYLKADAHERRLFITHDTMVQVLDLDSLKLVGTIEGTQRAHGVAWADELERGFISSGSTNSILVFDLKTLKKIGEIKAGQNPDAIVYDRTSDRVFAFNGEDGTATVADAATGDVLVTLALGGKPEFATLDGKGHVYDNLEDKNEVVEIDAKTAKILNRWTIAPGDSPSGLAMDRDSGRLFIGCHNQMMVVMNAQTGKVVQTLPIGKGVDATAFDKGSKTVYDSCGDGTVTVIHEDSPDQYSVVENVATLPGSRTMAVDGQTGRIFLPSAQFEPPSTPTVDHPKPHRKVIPGTFELLVVGK